ncbi:ryanodine receptor 2-like isoform X2 [Vicugna pacos]|uniref:Ryanodine receptor 2-like isoform X2 n=1 Tax=Vicugna pacos TaxID=30538 RepID=A0ABM5CH19_VICPA
MKLRKNYQLTSGYKPAPMDLSFIKLTPSQEAMVDKLAENAHIAWAWDRIRQGWTCGIQQDVKNRRNPRLVPYTLLDDRTKKSNKDSLCEVVCMLLGFVYSLEAPNQDHGQFAVSYGRSGKQLKRCHNSQPGMLPDSWSQMVKSLNVSSSVNQASRLIDGSEPSWQSSSSQGKVEIP